MLYLGASTSACSLQIFSEARNGSTSAQPSQLSGVSAGGPSSTQLRNSSFYRETPRVHICLWMGWKDTLPARKSVDGGSDSGSRMKYLCVRTVGCWPDRV